MAQLQTSFAQSDLVNLDQLQQLRNIIGNEKLQCYIEMALDHCDLLLEKDLAHIPSAEMRELTHSLIGSAGNTGLIGITNCARDLEQGDASQEEISVSIAHLKNVYEETKLLLHDFLREGQ